MGLSKVRKYTRGQGHRKRKRGSRVLRPPDPLLEGAPRSLIMADRTCRSTKTARRLVSELRNSFAPLTALKLKIRKANNTKSILDAARQLEITHLMAVSIGTKGTNLRLVRLPSGPSLFFRVLSYELYPDVVKGQRRRPHLGPNRYPAVPIFNNFVSSNAQHVQMVQTILTGMFPELQIDAVDIRRCQQAMLFHFNEDTEIIDVRHYCIDKSEVVKNKTIKKLSRMRMPRRKLTTMEDITKLVKGESGYFSETDSEADAEEITMPQKVKNIGANVRARIKLREIGPRMSLKLMKIVDGYPTGATIYHSYVERTPQEMEELERQARKREKLKKGRRDEQNRNVAAKKAKAEAKKQRRLAKRGTQPNTAATNEGWDDTEKAAPTGPRIDVVEAGEGGMIPPERLNRPEDSDDDMMADNEGEEGEAGWKRKRDQNSKGGKLMSKSKADIPPVRKSGIMMNQTIKKSVSFGASTVLGREPIQPASQKKNTSWIAGRREAKAGRKKDKQVNMEFDEG